MPDQWVEGAQQVFVFSSIPRAHCRDLRRAARLFTFGRQRRGRRRRVAAKGALQTPTGSLGSPFQFSRDSLKLAEEMARLGASDWRASSQLPSATLKRADAARPASSPVQTRSQALPSTLVAVAVAAK